MSIRPLADRLRSVRSSVTTTIKTQPPRVQLYAMRLAIKMHNILMKQDSIHRDTVYSKLSLDTSLF
jgi:hypothetical protein